MTKLKLKPARPDLLVRSPSSGRPLPVEGAEVPNNSYWRRRMKDGDVVTVEAAKPMVSTRVRRGEKPAMKKADD